MAGVSEYLKSLSVGDALGSAFAGLSEGHVNAFFRNVKGYPDSLPARKGNETRWRKNALYTGITQAAYILAVHSANRRLDLKSLYASAALISSSDISPWGAFRHPDAGLAAFLDKCYGKNPAVSDPVFSSLCSIVPAAVLAFPGEMPLKDAVKLCASLSRERYSFSSALVSAFACMMWDGSALKSAVAACDHLLQDKNFSPLIFECGINPQAVLELVGVIQSEADRLSFVEDEDNACEIISKLLSSVTGNNITRATVDHPFAVLLSGMFFADNSQEPWRSAAFRGGASASVASLAGGFASLAQKPIPQDLDNDLINRRRLFSFFEALDKGAVSVSECGKFLESEMSLTLKEREEYLSKIKHVKEPVKKKKAESAEERLSRHVVESWTKADKAKWRKEKRRGDFTEN